jgi:glucose/arabinose dehydrogenase
MIFIAATTSETDPSDPAPDDAARMLTTPEPAETPTPPAEVPSPTPDPPTPPPTAEDADDDQGIAEAGIDIRLRIVAGPFHQPTGVVSPDDGSDRLFILERPGVVRVVERANVLDEPFLDLREAVNWLGLEQGLLGLAVHPDYVENGRFFVNYTDTAGDTVISEFTVSANRNRADRESERVLLHIEQPDINHNGGNIAFGPDGYLYVGIGDGSDPGDPYDNAQDGSTLLGAMLRIDVDEYDEDEPYAIPAGNPFVDDPDVRDEIWAIGLRNPWRYSFDALTGDLYVADVGQWEVEEINVQPAGSPGGQNYGWPIMEGDQCFAADECDKEGLTMPVATYTIWESENCAIIGGYVYRGAALPELEGTYIYGDWCSGHIWGLRQDNGGWTQLHLLRSGLMISSFGLDERGEIYVADLRDGYLYRIVPH